MYFNGYNDLKVAHNQAINFMK